MEKNFIFAGIVFLGCLMPSLANAQHTRIAKQRLVLDEAISTIEDYETYATIADDEIRYSFNRLFKDEDVNVYNDLLGISNSKMLTVREYGEKIGEGLRNKKITIKNIKNDSIWYETDTWKIKLSFEKSMSYVNDCGIYFSSTDFYNRDYHLTAILAYDETIGKCKIEEINGSVDSSKRLPDSFFAFKSMDKRDKKLIYKHQRLVFNSYDQALLEGPYEKTGFKYSDPDVGLTPVVDACNNVSMKYRERRMRIKFHYDIGYESPFDLTGADEMKEIKANSSFWGVDLGYVFPSDKTTKTGFFVGLGMAKSTIETKFESEDYFYNTNADVDGDNYMRHYSDLKLTQKVNLTELVVPVYLDFNIKLHNLFSLYLDLGGRFNMSFGREVTQTEGSAYVYGVYPQYGDLRLDEHWGYNGFGNHSFTNSNLSNKDMDGVSQFTIDLYGAAGFRFNIPRTAFSIDVGANYQYGFMDILRPNGAKVRLDNGSNSPLVYNTIVDKNSTEHVRNLVEGFDSVKRRSLRLSMGVIYKF